MLMQPAGKDVCPEIVEIFASAYRAWVVEGLLSKASKTSSRRLGGILCMATRRAWWIWMPR